MQIVQENAPTTPGFGIALGEGTAAGRSPFADYKVIRRNGAVVGFEPAKISVAMTKAFLAVNGAQGAASARIRELVAALTDTVLAALMRRQPQGGTFHIEDIQDQVELALMRSGEHDVARAYVLYREERSKLRLQEKDKAAKKDAGIHVVENGARKPLDAQALRALVQAACDGLPAASPEAILEATLRDLYDGVPMEEVRKSAVMAARALIEKDPAYSYVTARLLLHGIRLEVLGEEATPAEMATRYGAYFPQFVARGIDAELLDPGLARFDLARLGRALKPERDLKFGYLGLQTLYDRYFLHVQGRRIELPQAFFMRVAMGLALRESDREARAIEFYDVLSSFDFMSSTPTLFNAATQRSQLSSCYLTTVSDDLEGIYDTMLQTDGDVYKMAVTAQTPEDVVRVLKLQQSAPKPTVAFCVGDIGQPSRFLALKYGAPWIYAAFNKERGIAPGLPSLEEFRSTYPVRSIKPDTRVFGVVGDPIGHSLSPLVHNHMFQRLKVNAVYLPFRVPRGQLPQALAAYDHFPVDGYSVTIPHKEAAAQLAAEKEPDVHTTGAANTLVRRAGGSFAAANTDFTAAVDSLKEHLMVPTEMREILAR